MIESLVPAPMTVDQLRSVDAIATRDFGMHSLVLMENAGRGAADHIARFAASGAVIVILCGTGNNGGDGLVIARHLHGAQFQVRVWMIGSPDKLSEDAAANYRILERTSVPCTWLTGQPEFSFDSDVNILENVILENVTEDNLPVASKDLIGMHPIEMQARDALESADVIVDAMLGTGARGEPRGWMAHLITIANRCRALRFAIDIPTGLDADLGQHGANVFRADETLTFVAPKLGFAQPAAIPVVGKLTVLPIGVPPEVLARAMALVQNF
jgi:NAD(P)H-hydrate epimerase